MNLTELVLLTVSYKIFCVVVKPFDWQLAPSYYSKNMGDHTSHRGQFFIFEYSVVLKNKQGKRGDLYRKLLKKDLSEQEIKNILDKKYGTN